MHQEAAPPVSARSGWFSARVGYSACEEADGIQSVRTRSRFDPCHSTPQTEGLASADHRIQLALGLEAAGGVGAADELDPTVLASPTARNFHYISLPPPPPLLPHVDELFFILHSTRVPRIPEPLPDAFKSWVRNALPFGDYYGNSKLRTRDIYGFDNEGSIFDEADFVVHLPAELNPSLVRTVNFVQKLFKPGSKRMPGSRKSSCYLSGRWNWKRRQTARCDPEVGIEGSNIFRRRVSDCTARPQTSLSHVRFSQRWGSVGAVPAYKW